MAKFCSGTETAEKLVAHVRKFVGIFSGPGNRINY